MSGDAAHPPGVALALARLGPVIDELLDALEAAGVGGDLADRAVMGVAQAYVAGHRDGAREAIAEIAPESARRGLHLVLSRELEETSLPG